MKFDREEAEFKREKPLVEALLTQLRLETASLTKADQRSGIDVLALLSDGRKIGIQVTEVDPFAARGVARASEKNLAKAAPNRPYFFWGQNDSTVVLDAIAHGIGRKVQIARRHSFDALDEIWLLICAGIPEHGAIGSTFIMTPWLSADDLNSATDPLLQGSKYHRCFVLPILGVEQSFYLWDKPTGWRKRVHLEAAHSTPREEYVRSLLEASSQQEFDRLVAEECALILREMRQG